MSDGQQFNQAAPRGALAEAADRFDRLVRGVKDQQLSETRSGPRIALTDSLVASPEEAWARNFMTQSIGPAVGGGHSAVVPADVSSRPATSAVASERPLLGGGRRQARKRSWLGWLPLGR